MKNNAFGAVAFCSYGSFWLAWWFLVAFPEHLADAGAHGLTAVGVFLLGWTIFTGYMTVIAVRINGMLSAVFIALSATFLFLTIGDLAALPLATTIGGYLGLLTAAFAWYGSFAGVYNYTTGTNTMPVWPRHARTAA